MGENIFSNIKFYSDRRTEDYSWEASEMKMNSVHPVARICGISGSQASDLPRKLVGVGAGITARCQMFSVLFLSGVSWAMLVAKAFDLEGQQL